MADMFRPRLGHHQALRPVFLN